jgi:hypothetical protein
MMEPVKRDGTLLSNAAGDRVRMQSRIRELERAVQHAHRILVDYQTACHNAGRVRIPAGVVRKKINPAVWRLAKVLPKESASTNND